MEGGCRERGLYFKPYLRGVGQEDSSEDSGVLAAGH